MTAALQAAPTEAANAKSEASSPLYLLDGHSLTFKAYYAIRGLTSPEGKPTGAVYGFLRMLLKLLEDCKPEYLAVVFDTGEPTFRDELFADYKAKREAPPADFGDQMQWIHELLDAMHITVFSADGYEADDLIATMATQSDKSGRPAVVVSADKDLFQLVNGRVRMLRFGAKDLEHYDEAAVVNKIGVKPSQVPDWLALVGDSSDNIPGVPTIGQKGAAKLLSEFETLENLIERAEEVKNERQRNSLKENAKQAFLSRKLATVHRDVPLDWDFESCRLPESLWNENSITLLSKLGFDSIIKEKNLKIPEKVFAEAKAAAARENYRLVCDAGELREWASEAAKAPWVALDTETTGVDPMVAELAGISLSCCEADAIYIPVAHRLCEVQIPIAEIREILNPIFSGKAGPALSAHNAKYDWKILERCGFSMADPAFDTMVAAFVLDPGKTSGHGLKALGSELFGLRMNPISDIIGSGKNQITIDEADVDQVCEYACRDADVTLRCTTHYIQELKKYPALEKLFYEVEIPLIPVLHKMEMGGFAIDPASLRQLSEKMNHEIHRLAREIFKEAGRDFNIDSPKQLGDVLFEELKLPTGKRTKTGYSTDTSVLETLEGKFPIARMILEYRQLTKLKSTYADSLPLQVHPKTKRIHTSFNQTIAQTGRLSSTNPNLQNIPVRTELGREIRRTFIPDSADHVLLSADYSQIELRILAHMSGDERLRNAYRQNHDIHALTASKVFGVEEKDVTSEMRGQAKTVNFGIIYGISAHGLAQRLHIARGEAAKFIQAYFETYPGVKRWIDKTLADGRKNGYVETLLGRRRWVPELRAQNSQLRGMAERIAVNAPIQGTSADMIKIAMINIDRELQKIAKGARMALQVHDELIFSVPRPLVESASQFIVEKMISALPLDVPIEVETHTGESWAEC